MSFWICNFAWLGSTGNRLLTVPFLTSPFQLGGPTYPLEDFQQKPHLKAWHM